MCCASIRDMSLTKVWNAGGDARPQRPHPSCAPVYKVLEISLAFNNLGLGNVSQRRVRAIDKKYNASYQSPQPLWIFLYIWIFAFVVMSFYKNCRERNLKNLFTYILLSTGHFNETLIILCSFVYKLHIWGRHDIQNKDKILLFGSLSYFYFNLHVCMYVRWKKNSSNIICATKGKRMKHYSRYIQDVD